MDRESDRRRDAKHLEPDIDDAPPRAVSPGKQSLTSRLVPPPLSVLLAQVAGDSPSAPTPSAPVQRAAAPSGPRPTSTGDDFGSAVRPDLERPRAQGIPEGVQRKMERAFGADFSTVTVHADSPRATELGALAFTQGESIHFAPGQYAPDTTAGQELLGHELTHVLQQREGHVAATAQAKDAAINDSSALEQQADDLGRRAAAGEVGLYRSAALGMRSRFRAAHGGAVVQRAVDSRFGTFKDVSYHNIKSPDTGKDMGVEMYMQFIPGRTVDATSIGLTQTVRSVRKGDPHSMNKQVEARSIPAGDAAASGSPLVDDDRGFHIDQHQHEADPAYGVTHRPDAPQPAQDDPQTPFPVRWLGPGKQRRAYNEKYGWRGARFEGMGSLGYRFKSEGRWKRKAAKLHDVPTFGENLPNSEQIFESAAVAREGNQAGSYYGSVSWGWRTDASGNFTRLPFTLVSEGVPSSTFLKSAEIWNEGESSEGTDNYDLPTVDVHVTTRAADLDRGGRTTSLPAGTRVQLLDNSAGSSGQASGGQQSGGSANESAGTESESSESSESSQAQGGAPASERVRVRVVGGRHTGLEGMIDRSALRDERS